MKTILIGIIALLLSSCSAQWHMQRALEIDPSIVKSKLTVLKETRKRDTLMFFHKTVILAMPSDTARIDSVVFTDIKPSFGPIVKKQGIVTISVEMIEGRLKAFATVDSTMIYDLRDSILLKDAIVDNLTTINKENTIVIDKYEGLLKKIALAIKITKSLAFIIIPLFIFFKLFQYYRKFKNKLF